MYNNISTPNNPRYFFEVLTLVKNISIIVLHYIFLEPFK
jgi:hypothetical protein